jgi:pimeloyl-ACP methyl ester carboxylesterase
MREKGWLYLLDEMVAAEKLPVPQWFLDRVLATDTGPWFAYTEGRPLWNWSPWDAVPRVNVPTLILAGELEDPDDVMGEVAALMPDATRVRIPDREHINAFLYSEFVVPRVIDFLATRRVVAPT